MTRRGPGRVILPKIYRASDSDRDKLEVSFIPHAGRSDQGQRYQTILNSAARLAELMTSLCPTSRELSKAIENIDQAVLWARAAMERNE